MVTMPGPWDSPAPATEKRGPPNISMPELCYIAAMATITLEVPDELAQRLEGVGDGLPWLLMYALDLAGIPGRSILPDTPSP